MYENKSFYYWQNQFISIMKSILWYTGCPKNMTLKSMSQNILFFRDYNFEAPWNEKNPQIFLKLWLLYLKDSIGTYEKFLLQLYLVL